MSQDASPLRPRLYGLFDGIEDEVPVDNDQSEDVGEHDDPTLDEIIERCGSVLLEDVAPSNGHTTIRPSREHQCLLHVVQLTG